MRIKIFILILLIFLVLDFSSSQTSTWTVQTLKEYTDQRFEAIQMAVLKAEQATEKRFEGVNEFRNTLSDQQRTLLPRLEYEAGHKELLKNDDELKSRLDKIENLKQGGNVTLAYIISIASLLFALISIFNIKKNLIKT